MNIDSTLKTRAATTYLFFIVADLLEVLDVALQVEDLLRQQPRPILHELQLLRIQQLHPLLHVLNLISHIMILI